MADDDVRISIVIPKEMDDYLHDHPDINRSEAFRNTINVLRNPLYQKLSDALIINFVATIIIILGFLMILLTPFVSFVFLIVCWLLSTTLLIGGTMLFVIIRRSNANGTNRK